MKRNECNINISKLWDQVKQSFLSQRETKEELKCDMNDLKSDMNVLKNEMECIEG